MFKFFVKFSLFFGAIYLSFINLAQAKKVTFVNNGALCREFNSPDEYPTIIKQPSVHLSKYPGKYEQPDGSFLFQVPKEGGRMYHYTLIEGTNNDDHIRLNGKLIINKLDMLGGTNTLTIEANSEIRLDPGMLGKPSGLDFVNISIFNIQQGVKLDKIALFENKKNITINFTSPDSSLEANNTILRSLVFDSSNNYKSSYININNASVYIQGKALFTYCDDNITLKDAEINQDGTVNTKTVSNLILERGLSKPGGNNNINMGKYSKIAVINGSMELNGNNTINMNVGSQFKGSLILKDGTSVINVLSGSKDQYKEDINKVNIDNLFLNNKTATINIGDYANFHINNGINSSASTKIFVGKSSIFNVKEKVDFFSGNNSLYFDEQATITGSFKFSSGGYNNSVVVNTGNSSVTLNGYLIGSRNNDSFTLLGNGVFYVNNSSLPGEGLSSFNSIDLGQGRIEFTKHNQHKENTTYIISLFPKGHKEDNPRLKFNGLTHFNNTTINLKFKGVTQNLGKVGDVYDFTFLRNGEVNSGYLTDLSSIALKDITLKSALYKLKWEIKNDSDLTLKLEKYRTFKEAVGDKKDYYIKEGIVEIASFLDKIVDLKELNQKYYDMLDELAMIDELELKQVLRSFIPINNTVLFNINKNLAQDFTEVTLNSKPYKIVKNDLVLWSSYKNSRITIDNNKSVIGGKAISGSFMGGTEYSLNNFLKLGGVIGGNQHTTVNGNLGYFSGTSNNNYYGIYGASSITNDLTLNVNLGFLNSSYELKRFLFNDKVIYASPKFKHFNIDSLLSYKIRMADNLMLNPFISFSYNHGNMASYKEGGADGDILYNIERSNFSELSSGIGVKAILVEDVAWGYLIPSVSLGIYQNFQQSKDTKAQLWWSSDLNEAINFSTQNYGGLFGKGELSISYNLYNCVILDLTSGANIGKDLKSYNIGLSISILL